MGVIALVTVAGSLPIFLVGALAVFIRQDLRFDEAQLGLAVALFYASSGLSSIPGGRLAERRGAPFAVRAAAMLSAGAVVGVAAVAHSWPLLVACLVPAGVAHGLAHPAANLALVVGIPAGRQGFAHGLKQSAVPIATLLSGLTVPALGLTIGWRYAFVLAALVPLAALAVRIPSRRPPGGRPASGGPRRSVRDGDVPIATMIVLSVATGCGAAAAISLSAFLVEAGVLFGMTATAAGLLLASGGIAGVLTRIVVGWLADRKPGRPLAVVAGMLGLGALGYLLLSYGNGRPVAIVVGALLAFSAGWGWTGLLNFAVLRRNTNAPAAASGIIQAGAAAGGTVGPLIFGAIAVGVSFPAAWTFAAGLAAAASALLMFGRVLVRRHLRTPTSLPDAAQARG